MHVIWKRPDGFHGADPSDFMVVNLGNHREGRISGVDAEIAGEGVAPQGGNAVREPSERSFDARDLFFGRSLDEGQECDVADHRRAPYAPPSTWSATPVT